MVIQEYITSPTIISEKPSIGLSHILPEGWKSRFSLDWDSRVCWNCAWWNYSQKKCLGGIINSTSLKSPILYIYLKNVFNSNNIDIIVWGTSGSRGPPRRRGSRACGWCIYIYIYIYVLSCIMCVHIYTYIYIYIYIHTYCHV